MASSIMMAVHHLKISNEYIKDFQREHPNTRGGTKFGEYGRKVDWIIRDIITYPHFRDEVREAIKGELLSEPFSYESIVEKASLLNPQQREVLEDVIDMVLRGETIKVTNDTTEGLSDRDSEQSE